MENRRKGRPPLSPEDRRDGDVGIRLTDRERAAIEARAAAHGLTLSEFFRRRALSQPLPEARADRQATAELTTALLRLGVNLKQAHDRQNEAMRGRWRDYNDDRRERMRKSRTPVRAQDRPQERGRSLGRGRGLEPN